jgi:3-hydroxymyristoyl/3-hydroxydecanoyl-(acyl carrier protein) dehydratase
MSRQLSRDYAAAFDLRNRLLAGMNDAERLVAAGPEADPAVMPAAPNRQVDPPAFPREMCMEFAVGSAARVLGPEFADLDRYPARVRLPDEPLMLVDRIISIEGQKGQLGPGRIVTEHDVSPGAWYLDADRAPVCISVEAGQADLFLCSYLGIDLKVRGERTYRLLDAAVTFHRGLPRPGDVIRYEIAIEKFIRQGETWLFFFHFDGYIGEEHLITMRDGCAGFFTAEEVRQSGGILLKGEESARGEGRRPTDWRPPVPLVKESYDDAAVDALRRGEAAACFGEGFADVAVPPALRLPGGRMRLLERVLAVEPEGGRYGLGSIRAEADIHPDDWFLTCHFVDDRVMPGTLMYECCAHTLRILLQRMGWISDGADVCYEPVIGKRSVLRCRGPVTPETRHVVYAVEISEIGFNPAPYVRADAHMYADGHHIVMFRGMSMQMSGMTRERLDAFWRTRRPPVPTVPLQADAFSREQILAFARGKPSDAFGAPYRPFDRERFIARLPAPPYAFISRVTRVDPPPWELKPNGWAHIAWDMQPDDWYFRAHRSDGMPLCILMEIGLQACGFLAAYMGSALKSEKDLRFRNLDGRATLEANVRRDRGPVTARARLLSSSMAGDMLIEQFAFEIFQQDHRVYAGETSFGFFTEAALDRQVGLGKDDHSGDWERWRAGRPSQPVTLADLAPLTPDDPEDDTSLDFGLPATALRMIDRIEQYDPRGGDHGLGYLRASKAVDPRAWFFEAHFFQDPVCPGSLGIESLIQLLRWAARQRWPERATTHMPLIAAGQPHTWRYRGQIRPTNRQVTLEAVINALEDGAEPALWANGYLKVDGLCIYRMQNFGLRLVKRRQTPKKCATRT